MKDSDIITGYYREEAKQYGFSSLSTTGDSVVRKKEIKLISDFLSIFVKKRLKVLDIGCGNGYALSVLSSRYPEHSYFGLDFSKELLSIAKKRKLERCKFVLADARFLPFGECSFDIVYSERCLINILDWHEQQKALKEIHRVLKYNGLYLMIECFRDGLINNNKTRRIVGLSELSERFHNRYFDKDIFFKAIKGRFVEFKHKRVKSNFLSAHYFIARVLHPLIGGKRKNTKFVKFFSFLPAIGNYSQIQAYILKKI